MSEGKRSARWAGVLARVRLVYRAARAQAQDGTEANALIAVAQGIQNKDRKEHLD